MDALDAYRMKLVKKIEVKGFDIKNLRGTDGYLFLENIVISPKKPPMARLEFEIRYEKSINRETRIVGVDDDLYALSKGMEQYQGYHINEIDPVRGAVTFTNGMEIHTGEVLGDVSERIFAEYRSARPSGPISKRKRNCTPVASRPFPCSLSIRWRITGSMMLTETK